LDLVISTKSRRIDKIEPNRAKFSQIRRFSKTGFQSLIYDRLKYALTSIFFKNCVCVLKMFIQKFENECRMEFENVNRAYDQLPKNKNEVYIKAWQTGQTGVPIVTAGGSRSLSPPDILVGTVSRVVERVGSAGPVLEIELVADLSNLSFLRVLLYQPITEKVAP
jgi:hypothetical protein